MLDTIQILLTVVISVLTVLLTIIGLAIYQILKEFKKSIEKINLVLDDTHRMTNAVAQPVEDASEFLHGLKSGVSLLRAVSRYLKEEKKQKKSKTEEVVTKQAADNSKAHSESDTKKRFFSQAGRILKKPL